MVRFSKKEIAKAVDVLHDALRERNFHENVYLILIGAASLIVKHNLKRATSDIDIMDTGIPRCHIGGLGALLSQLGYHVVSDAIVNLHPDYLERVEEIVQKDNVFVLSLGPYDLAISKISRGLQRDIDDLLVSDVLASLKIDRLERLYAEAATYWVGNTEHFRLNWDMFIDAYNRYQNGVSGQADPSGSDA
ncbi:MAG: DUF6036 family nucleotidyltransferase [Thermodesulfobacteriota bacterium]|nr:DUF6036 family nucleotidyltransferase [Thermodesulfobacteriota bacterium]